eukprot:15021261-Alexandrium_andersonii.AAC.1
MTLGQSPAPPPPPLRARFPHGWATCRRRCVDPASRLRAPASQGRAAAAVPQASLARYLQSVTCALRPARRA